MAFFSKKMVREVSLPEVSDLMISNQIVFPDGLQRRPVWTRAQSSQFLSSATAGFALQPIIAVNIEESLDACEARGETISANYYRSFNGQGFKFTGLDGRNRLAAIADFMNNKISVTGVFTDADGKSVELINKFYKQIPQRLKDRFTDCTLPWVELVGLTRPELALTFERINAGVALVPQELRNCRDTPIAQVVRDVSKNLKPGLSRILNADAISRMGDDELVAKLLLQTYQEQIAQPASNKAKWYKGCKKEDLEKFYNEGLGYLEMSDPGCPYDQKALKFAQEVLTAALVGAETQTAKPPSSPVGKFMSHLAVGVISVLYGRGYVIKPGSHGDLFDEITHFDKKLTDESKVQEGNDISNEIDVSTNVYYHKLKNDQEKRGIRLKMLGIFLERMDEELKRDPHFLSIRLSTPATVGKPSSASMVPEAISSQEESRLVD